MSSCEKNYYQNIELWIKLRKKGLNMKKKKSAFAHWFGYCVGMMVSWFLWYIFLMGICDVMGWYVQTDMVALTALVILLLIRVEQVCRKLEELL